MAFRGLAVGAIGSPAKKQRIETKSTHNNFDLIRLFAATQVAIAHTAEHLNFHFGFLKVLEYFPGVPVFFFISGYLIYKSYANIRENNLRIFFTNRILRLYAALYACFFLTVASIYLSGYFSAHEVSFKQLAVWTFTSLTFFQFYNPDFLREYGVGAINGSLWTIAVELQFYILTPILFIAYKKYRKIALAIFIFLIAINAANTFLNIKDGMLFKLFSVSFIP
ncbi:acyltransferase family protein [Sphingomonas soli]|uniref:acyltransferase family protein n=1 Tax=Sphingomonas soli TaxID=266127 RepID=UPI000837A206|nr:acyltransferase [Sphingomonas soli]